MKRRRRCQVCGELFRADPRVGERQRACSRRECQQERRRQTQASWRERNPDYFLAWRLSLRAATTREAEASAGTTTGRAARSRRPPPLAVPLALRRIPWALAQDEIGVQVTDFLAVVACLLVRIAKDQRLGQVLDSA